MMPRSSLPDDRLGLHDDEEVGPAGPDAAQDGPDEPGEWTELRARLVSLEHGDSLPQSEDRQCEIAPAAEEDADCIQRSKDELGC